MGSSSLKAKNKHLDLRIQDLRKVLVLVFVQKI